MPTDYYLQNRTFDKDRDIECGGKMVVGSAVVQEKLNYLYETAPYNQGGINLNTSETKKTADIGQVVLNSGKRLNLEAKNSIVLKSGFKASNGSIFTAKVDGTDPNTRSDDDLVKSCPKIVLSDKRVSSHYVNRLR